MKGIKVENRPKWLVKLQRPWYVILHNLVSQKWCGSDDIPLRGVTLLKFDNHQDRTAWNGEGYRYAGFIDSNEIGIGWHNKWDCLIRRNDFHQIVMNYLFYWIFIDWFGLRTKLWYWTLRIIVDSYKTAEKIG